MADDIMCLNAPRMGREYQMWLQKRTENLSTKQKHVLKSSWLPLTAISQPKAAGIFLFTASTPPPEKPSSAFHARECKAAKFSLRCLLPLLLHLPFFKRPHTDCQFPFSASTSAVGCCAVVTVGLVQTHPLWGQKNQWDVTDCFRGPWHPWSGK